jgi:hypothetical protein
MRRFALPPIRAMTCFALRRVVAAKFASVARSSARRWKAWRRDRDSGTKRSHSSPITRRGTTAGFLSWTLALPWPPARRTPMAGTLTLVRGGIGRPQCCRGSAGLPIAPRPSRFVGRRALNRTPTREGVGCILIPVQDCPMAHASRRKKLNRKTWPRRNG